MSDIRSAEEARRLYNLLQSYFLSHANDSMVGARVFHSANIAVATATVTVQAFNSERSDPSGMHDTSSNTGRFTISEPGRYLITAHIEWAANAVGLRLVTLRVNGATNIASQAQQAVATGDVTIMSVATIYDFVAADYVEVIVYQSSGGNLNVVADANRSPEFAISRLP